ncbi:hypothetical protein CHS0354_042145 [Potamilus streckersoni]|uniref:Uncharacterized protein n=1 Tax=Potamilus streckersoni TaxID=2493646 RepID=A0AAE0WFU4_9BIVA|nr:hypothetical protein CHS0354_042145 [Potamilus streckersoni]
MEGYLIWIFFSVYTICLVLGSECIFPLDWRGTWYQSRAVIDISVNSISRKGTCIHRDGNRFLVLNKDHSNRKCFSCLVFTRWHHNLLQYKESNCWYEDSLETVCGHINGDALLHTLVKVPNIPEPCPFHGSYTFTYTNSTMSSQQCNHPVSEIRACADESRFKFIFKHCPGVQGTYNQVLDFKCVATWENGEKFLYGVFSEPWMTQDEYRYRCFMHSFYGRNGDMSMSADATCQGLQSTTLGAVSMSLTRVIRPRSTCTFPRYLANQNKWRDLSGRIRLEVDAGLQVLRFKDILPHGTFVHSDGPEVSVSKLVLRCIHSVGQSIIDFVTDFFTYYTNDSCESGYQCLRVIKRDENVIELYMGDSTNNTEASCNYEQSTKYILIPDRNDSVPCPTSQKGIYMYTDKASDCSGKVDIGCTNDDEIVIETTCATMTKSVSIIQCLQNWRLEEKTFLITKQPGHLDNPSMCLTFIETDFGLEVQADNYCEGDRWIVKKKFLNYLLYTPPDNCPDRTYVQSDQHTHSDGFQNDSKVEEHTSIAAARTSNVFILACVFIVCSLFLIR